jgi:hypothetical protein
MNREVSEAVEELKRAFHPSEVTVVDDNTGGAYVIIETVELGPRYNPCSTWIGGHVPALYPAADIYPVFIDAQVARMDGKGFEVPITLGHSFSGRAAIQISRRNNQIHLGPQSAVGKFTKILNFLERLP